jgi:hypothetical protein
MTPLNAEMLPRFDAVHEHRPVLTRSLDHRLDITIINKIFSLGNICLLKVTNVMLANKIKQRIELTPGGRVE